MLRYYRNATGGTQPTFAPPVIVGTFKMRVVPSIADWNGDSWPVQPVGLRVGVGDGGRAWAWASWWGGIPTCDVLRPVGVHRTGHVIRLDLREGSDAPPGTACAEIAMLKSVRIDLGPLPPGTYVVRAGSKRATLAV